MIRTLLCVALLGAFAIPEVAAASWPETLQEDSVLADYAAFAKHVEVKEAAETKILFREFQGSYAQHPSEIMKMLEAKGGLGLNAETPLMGIYPNDPDLVAEADLRWQLAFAGASDGAEKLGFQVRTLPATKLIAVETTVAKASSEGLLLLAWLSLNGYVQTDATRMIYGSSESKDPLAQPITILVPAKRRAGAQPNQE